MEPHDILQSLHGRTVEECEQMIDNALAHNSKIKFMRDSLEKSGCHIGRNFFKAERCGMATAGGFNLQEGIIVCSNTINRQSEVDQVLIHELIHAYDQCRAANLKWHNCFHHACSEIRAGNLSGDCHFKQELLRGYLGIRKHHQDCVRRRSLKSVSMNPFCPGSKAEKSIDKVWDTCYKDTKPFDKVP